MIHLSIQADARRVLDGLSEAGQKQAPFAIARALTALAFEVQRVERAAMGEVFKRPRPFTQRSVLVTKATKGVPVATVFLRPEAAAYLAPYEFGGQHRAPGRGLAVLTPKAAPLDAYGQLRGKPSLLASRPDVFVGAVQTAQGRIWGFWRRLLVSKHLNPGVKVQRLQLLLRASDPLPVHGRLGFADRARAVVQVRAVPLLREAMAQAMATARR